MISEPAGHWHAPVGVSEPVEVPPEAARWPGHCYRSPWPLSEDYFLAAYSFDPLIGEPTANRANMFGIYLVDRFGNKELLYRDLDISSLWPMPLRARKRPTRMPSVGDEETVSAATGQPSGTFFLQNVYEAGRRCRPTRSGGCASSRCCPSRRRTSTRRRVGLANASPGKQVLGTVPVEPTARPISPPRPACRWRFRPSTSWAGRCRSCGA